jgi:Kef-type K+ transport system membrane component KefB
MVATSIGITAQVLAAKGLLKQLSARIILAAAVIDDVLGLLVLALVSSISKGQVNIAGLAVTGILAVGFTWLVAKFGSRTLGHVVPRVEHRLRVAEAQFTVAMVLLFALALGAVYAGVAAIIGAFLAGMALSETVNQRVNDLAHGVSELLTPFFLVGIGLHLDLGVFSKPSTIMLSLVILLAAIASKLVGCGLGALNLGWRDALRIGVGMMPRGEVGLVVAQLGFAMGVIKKDTYGVVVFMAVATTIIAPPALNLVYRGVKGEPPEERYELG